jgi:hypothetical protein
MLAGAHGMCSLEGRPEPCLASAEHLYGLTVKFASGDNYDATKVSCSNVCVRARRAKPVRVQLWGEFGTGGYRARQHALERQPDNRRRSRCFTVG